MKKVLVVTIIGLLIWHGIRSIQSFVQVRRWNLEKEDIINRYTHEIATKDTVIQNWIKRAERHAAELHGWYKVTGAYDPMHFEGITIVDTIIIGDIPKERISFEIDTGSIYIQAWTIYPFLEFDTRLNIDPLSMRLGIVRDGEGDLISDYIWVSDPLFKITDVKIEQLWEDKVVYKTDWFGWLLGGQILYKNLERNLDDYEIGVSGGIRLGRTSVLIGIDSRDFKNISIIREF